MGSGRRAVPTHHAFTGKEQPCSWNNTRTEYEQFDGEFAYYKSDYRHNILDATCRDCGRAYGKIKLAEVADRLTVEKLETTRVKTAVIVSVDGVKRAVVFFRKGFAQCWHVARYKERDIREGYGFYSSLGGEMDAFPHRKKDEVDSDLPPGIYNIHKSAMDAMLSIVPALVAAGKLPTEAEEKAAEETKRQERAAAEQRLEQSRQQSREEAQHAREALKTVVERAQALGLTNYEIAGLMLAQRRI